MLRTLPKHVTSLLIWHVFFSVFYMNLKKDEAALMNGIKKPILNAMLMEA